MGGKPSSPLKGCFEGLCEGRQNCMAWHEDAFYDTAWARRRNLDIGAESSVVFRPETTEDVQAAIACAIEHGASVQALSGGHSFGNHAMATKGSVVIDVHNFDNATVDQKTWNARLGSGLTLKRVDEALHKQGTRAMAHGTCPSVGIGGHASVGGLGPMSRMWGSALDHVIEVEIVTADGAVRRANETHNEDLFWAVRGAGASFGVVTEYVVKTHAAPGRVIEFTYSFSFGSQVEMIPIFKEWQGLAGDPTLDRRFSSQFIAQPLGAIVTGTFYGSEADFKATGISERMPKGGPKDIKAYDWFASLLHQAELATLALAEIPVSFDTKSLALTKDTLLDDDGITQLFTYMHNQRFDSLLWVVIFNTEGGAMADTPRDGTAYPHRDSLIMYQSYAIGLPKVSEPMRNFVSGIDKIMRDRTGAKHTYAGYIDPDLDRVTAQEMYWGSNLPRLREIKSKYDPNDVFRNPQSVQPAPVKANAAAGVEAKDKSKGKPKV
ncbi:FAD-linked oxidoreductase sorD [Paramyrothecium foliicola]|nr:FAD-linked oxidoreductase sorD [Paramyrothecium foliicola]